MGRPCRRRRGTGLRDGRLRSSWSYLTFFVRDFALWSRRFEIIAAAGWVVSDDAGEGEDGGIALDDAFGECIPIESEGFVFGQAFDGELTAGERGRELVPAGHVFCDAEESGLTSGLGHSFDEEFVEEGVHVDVAFHGLVISFSVATLHCAQAART